jgi:hypothetical protein
VGPRAGLDTKVRGKILCLCRGSNLDRPVFQSVATSSPIFSPYLEENTINNYKDQFLMPFEELVPLYSESYDTNKHTLWEELRVTDY